MMNLSGQRILVIGLGKTGTATARFLCRQGADVIVTDEKDPSELKDPLGQLKHEGIHVRYHPCVPELVSDVQMVIPSPGVPPSNRMLVEAGRSNKPIVSELELASLFLNRPMIAITGTNGKTTTTSLVGKMLSKSGISAFIGGNIGSPLIGYVGGPQQDKYVVVEVSSFQLQWTREFRPDVAVLLNVTPDHVDYHGTLGEYRLAKEMIFRNQTNRDLAVLNAEDATTDALSHRIKAKIAYFSSARELSQGIYLNGRQIIYRPSAGECETYPIDMINVPGVHNIENVMAAVIAARWAGCPRESIIEAVGEFHGIAHRIEFAGERKGILFYDDSKATNVDAVLRALETFSAPVVLLMGGRDKEGDFRMLSSMVASKVKMLIAFGEAREKIKAILGVAVKSDHAATLREAMPLALEQAKAGDVVLLAPGCTSFDEFKDYKERGDVFKQWVGSLT